MLWFRRSQYCGEGSCASARLSVKRLCFDIESVHFLEQLLRAGTFRPSSWWRQKLARQTSRQVLRTPTTGGHAFLAALVFLGLEAHA